MPRAAADEDRAAMSGLRPDEAARNGGEHEDGFEPFAEDEQRGIDDDGGLG